jgi:hypothetical protein
VEIGHRFDDLGDLQDDPVPTLLRNLGYSETWVEIEEGENSCLLHEVPGIVNAFERTVVPIVLRRYALAKHKTVRAFALRVT